ncbi:MAG: hypothetical protein RL728_460, partial [Bacteroidota bacterium]
MFSDIKVTEIFCVIDDFCKQFYSVLDNHS